MLLFCGLWFCISEMILPSCIGKIINTCSSASLSFSLRLKEIEILCFCLCDRVLEIEPFSGLTNYSKQQQQQQMNSSEEPNEEHSLLQKGEKVIPLFIKSLC